MRMFPLAVCVATALFASAAARAAPGDAIGSAVTVVSLVTAKLEADQRELAKGDDVRQQELIEVATDGRSELVLRDNTKLALGPGQVLVLGCWPDRPGSLGHFLFTKPEPNSDRLLQCVVFLWAVPTGPTEIPWVDPVTPPTNLRPVDPSEVGLGKP